MERLEDRNLLAANLGVDPFADLLTHGGACSCPICSGQGLEAFAPQQATAIAGPSSAATIGITPAGVPVLNSRLGARATLYLDFNGNVESRWGERTNIATPAYDIDGNYASFSALEVANIRAIWAQVSEDYAPFNINVTTVAPQTIADRASVRLAIGGNYSDWFGSSAGGVAYIGGFFNGASNVGYVFEDALGNGNAKYVAEAASHEAGHLFGLSHQAQWSGGTLVTEYNAGDANWAPIMGVGYYSDRTTWAIGPTTAGPSSRQDDLAILAGPTNGFGYVADDYGNTTAAAALLPIIGSSVTITGLIGRDGDRDVFKFSTGGGQVNFTLDAAASGANLDGVLELVNSAGATLAVANPAASFGATLARPVAAGTYYVVVRASGGYGNLGRYTLRGTVSSTSQPQTPQPPQAMPPEISVSVNGTNLLDGGVLSFGGTTQNAAVTRVATIRNAGGGTLNLTPLSTSLPAGYSLVSNITQASLAAGQSTSFTIRLNATQNGTFSGGIALANNDANEGPFNLTLSGFVGQFVSSPTPTARILDNGSAGFTTSGAWQLSTGSGNASDTHWVASGAASSAATWNFTGLAPGQYRLAATWPASRLYATDAPFSVVSGNQNLATVRVNQQRAAATFADAGANWQNLGTFAISGNTLSVRLNGSTTGRVVADSIRLERVYSTSGGTAFHNAVAIDDELAGAPVFATMFAPQDSRPLHESPAAALAAVDALFASQQMPATVLARGTLLTFDEQLAAVEEDESQASITAADELFAGLELTGLL